MLTEGYQSTPLDRRPRAAAFVVPQAGSGGGHQGRPNGLPGTDSDRWQVGCTTWYSNRDVSAHTHINVWHSPWPVSLGHLWPRNFVGIEITPQWPHLLGVISRNCSPSHIMVNLIAPTGLSRFVLSVLASGSPPYQVYSFSPRNAQFLETVFLDSKRQDYWQGEPKV